MQSSTFNIEIHCTIVSVVTYRKIFQVYNNFNYVNVDAASVKYFIKLQGNNKVLIDVLEGINEGLLTGITLFDLAQYFDTH